MPTIERLLAREILDSRGNPTVEVDLLTSKGVVARGAVPSGASTGAYEAHELRDGDASRYKGKGVTKAIENLRLVISEAICGQSFDEQSQLDTRLIQLDGSENKSHLGANAILGVSMAFLKALAIENSKPLYKMFGREDQLKLPVPLMNVLNGGAHANNGLDVQEFMVVPVCGGSFKEALRAGSEIFQTLKSILNKQNLSTAVGDEGGFAPVLKSNEEALTLLLQAIEQAGYRPQEDVRIALDVAATELFKDGKYTWEGKQISAAELGGVYQSWMEKYPLCSIEDGFAEDDWEGWKAFTAENGSQVQLVGDDLFVTNRKRLQRGIDEKSANALLVKINQIGTISETLDAVTTAQQAGFHTVMSHRSGETEDTLIADLAVGMGSEQIKTGSLCRGERIAKYNQLLRIEEELGDRAQYWGTAAFD